MNQLSLLLLVDSDRKGLEALTHGFEREGCAVAGTIDPAMAPELARATTPQLAVISLQEPDPRVLSLITSLRGLPSTKDLPVVTLGPAALRQAAMAAGASDFLSTPIFVRDVVNVGKLMLAMREAMASNRGDSEPELQARLSEYDGLYYIVRAMSATNRSGILQLNRGNKKGEVRFSQGTVTSAHVGSQQAVPALHQLLLWEEAAMSLRLRPVVRRDQFSMAPAELLNECERFLRDFAHAAHDLGSPRTIYVAASGTPAAGAKKVPPEATPVLRLFNGERTLSEVIEDSPFRIFDTLRVIKRLLDVGRLTLKPGSAIRDDAAASRMDQWMLRPTASVPTPLALSRPSRPSGAHPLAAAIAPQGRPTPARLSRVPEQRTTHGDRRKSNRHRALSSGQPAPQNTSVAIPLTVRKSAAEWAVAEGAGSGRGALRAPPPAAARAAIDSQPSIHMRLDAAFPPLPVPPVANDSSPSTAEVVPAGLVDPPPVSTPPGEAVPVAAAAPGSGPVAHAAKTPPPHPSKGPDSKTRLKKAGHARLTPASTFDAIESDFFAREADLYKHDVVESFDDLDRGGSARKMQPARIAPASSARKKR